MKDLGTAENWRRPCYVRERKHGQTGRMGRNSWYLQIERQAEKGKAAWKRRLSLGSPNICGSTPHLALIPPWRETTCRTVWILIFHTFPCKQKHTGMFRRFWYLERNKWEPLAVKLYCHSDIPFSSHEGCPGARSQLIRLLPDIIKLSIISFILVRSQKILFVCKLGLQREKRNISGKRLFGNCRS